MESAFAVMAWTVAILIGYLTVDFIVDHVRSKWERKDK